MCSTLNDSEFQQAILKVTLCGCYMFAFLLTSPLISCCCCKTNSWVGSKKMETALPLDSCIAEKVLPASCLRSRQCFQNKISTAFEKHRAMLGRNASSRSVAHAEEPQSDVLVEKSGGQNFIFIHKKKKKRLQTSSVFWMLVR